MPSCAIFKCGNYNQKTKGTEIKYFRFPKIDDICKNWVVACHREDKINLKNACICSEHFEASSFEIPLRERLLNYTYKTSRNLKPDAVPALKLPGNNGKQQNKRQAEDGSNRSAKRIRTSEVNDMLNNHVSEAVFIDPNQNNNDTEVNDMMNNHVTNNVQVDLATELKKAQDEIQKLKSMLKAAENNQTELSNKLRHMNDIWSQLNVGHNKNCFFPHPENNALKVFVYADVPHLLKLARNHLIDHGFVLENSVINKDSAYKYESVRDKQK